MVENISIPTLEEWRKLYEAAVRVKEIAPWEWMEEADIFGVQNPETDELGFVSVMGTLGEHYAIAVYLGAKGLYGFWSFHDRSPFVPPELLLEIPQLHASFENRNYLRKKDHAIVKELGLQFRGQRSWPMFRSHRPGFLPWFLESAETHFLTYVLEQVLDVAPRFREDPSLLSPPDDDSYLVRVLVQEDNATVWEDRVIHVPPPPPTTVEIPMNVRLLEALKSLGCSKHKIEVDFFMFPSPLREGRGGNERPFYPYMLMMVDTYSGMILDSELLQPHPSLEDMWASIPLKVVSQFARIGIVPEEVKARSSPLFELLQPLAEELRFNLKQSHTLRRLDQSKDFLLQRFI